MALADAKDDKEIAAQVGIRLWRHDGVYGWKLTFVWMEADVYVDARSHLWVHALILERILAQSSAPTDLPMDECRRAWINPDISGQILTLLVAYSSL